MIVDICLDIGRICLTAIGVAFSLLITTGLLSATLGIIRGEKLPDITNSDLEDTDEWRD